MGIWHKVLESVSRSPRGYVADGRTLGLGLATALEKSQQDTTDVEAYLRDQTEQPVTTGPAIRQR
jgi:hypothetical protein